MGGWIYERFTKFKEPQAQMPQAQVFINYSKQEKLYKFLCVSCLIQSGPEAVCVSVIGAFPHENVQLFSTECSDSHLEKFKAF